MDEKASVILRNSGVRPRGSASVGASSVAVECNANVAGEVVTECDGTICAGAAFGWATKAEVAERLEHSRSAERADRSIILNWLMIPAEIR